MNNIDWGMLFLIFTAGFFWGEKIGQGITLIMRMIRARKTNKRMKSVIDQLKSEAGVLVASASRMASEKLKQASQKHKEEKKEIHSFQWRKDGVLNEVKIIIDPTINHSIPGSKEDFEKLMKESTAENLEELIKKVSPGADETVDNFVFSTFAVEQMKLAGVSPDEIVVKMLKAAGRMD
jgi:sulfite reductase alpha subunit-like flavoprotein